MLKRIAIVAIVCGLLAALAAGCGRKKKREIDTRLLAPRETYRLARDEIQRDNLRRAIDLLSRIDYRLGEDRALLEPLVRITTADATFYQNNDLTLIDARALYLDFVTLYADHELAPYALYQAGICSLSQVSAPSKDQTETFQAIRDLRSVEMRFPVPVVQTVEARLLRPLTVGRQQNRLVQIDRLRLGVGANVPETHLVLVAHPVGEVGGRTPVQRLQVEVVPVVQDDRLAIFGPTDESRGFRPVGDRVLTVDLGNSLACRPCSVHGSRRCPQGHHRCMNDLRPSDVIARIEAWPLNPLTRSPDRPRAPRG